VMRKILVLPFLFSLLLFSTSSTLARPPRLINEDFNSPISNFVINGFNFTPYQDLTNGEMVLTVNTTGCCQAGSVFYSKPIRTAEFYARFDFRIENGDPGGADGLTFAVVDANNSTLLVLGSSGQRLGYSGLSGFAVEFDTFGNAIDGFDSNHVGVDINGSVESIFQNNNIPNLEDNGYYTAEVVLRGGKHLEVFLSNSSIGYERTKVVDIDLPDFTPFNSLVGFTASTGQFRSKHIIDNFTLQVNPITIP
jgi:hypothetical protein